MNRLDILDFDRTLGKVEVFSEGIIGNLIELGRITAAQQADIQEALEHPDTVDLVGLLRVYGIPVADIVKATHSVTQDPLYEDVDLLFARLENIWVVTSAQNKSLQAAKLKRSGLEGVSTVVAGNKSDFILKSTARTEDGRLIFEPLGAAQEFDAIRVVDDRFEQIAPLICVDGFDPILLQRPDAKYMAEPSQKSQINVIHSLDELI